MNREQIKHTSYLAYKLKYILRHAVTDSPNHLNATSRFTFLTFQFMNIEQGVEGSNDTLPTDICSVIAGTEDILTVLKQPLREFSRAR